MSQNGKSSRKGVEMKQNEMVRKQQNMQSARSNQKNTCKTVGKGVFKGTAQYRATFPNVGWAKIDPQHSMAPDFSFGEL